jgi:uroporphyrinogen-III synthase
VSPSASGSTSHSTSSSGALGGLRVVVTRPRDQAAELGAGLVALGAEVVYLPVIEIADPPSWDELDLALRKLAEGLYSWIVFSSANAVAKTFERIYALGLDARALGRTKVAAVGPVSARLLKRYGILADLVPEPHTGEAAANAIGRGVGRVLVPRSSSAPGAMLEVLEAAGWIPEEVDAYETVAVEHRGPEADAVRAGVFDAVVFMSGSAARAFGELVTSPELVGLGESDAPQRLVVCIGPSTAGGARAAGFRVDVVARDHSAAGLLEGLVERVGPAGSD